MSGQARLTCYGCGQAVFEEDAIWVDEEDDSNPYCEGCAEEATNG